MNKSKSKKRVSARKPKLSKTVKTAVKEALKKNVETKTINVPVSPGTTINSQYVPYGALSGVQYLARDIFSLTQGVEDSTVIGAPNRVGDRIKGVGFLMDYYFSIPNSYTVGATAFYVPYVKLRITVFKQAFGTPTLNQALLYDTNFLNGFTSTMQPINWDEGYVKEVMYDKVHIIRNNLSAQSGGVVGITVPPSGNLFHFKKYIKYDNIIKYTDNQSTSPNSTDKPISIAISAEVDDSNTGLVPSGTKIIFSTGYTRCWFKDT